MGGSPGAEQGLKQLGGSSQQQMNNGLAVLQYNHPGLQCFAWDHRAQVRGKFHSHMLADYLQTDWNDPGKKG